MRGGGVSDVRARALRRVRRPGGRRGAGEKLSTRTARDYGQFFVGLLGRLRRMHGHIIRLYKRGRLKNFDTTVDGFRRRGAGIFRGKM